MTDEEFEKIWADCKRRDAQREAEFNALPEEEKKRLEREFIDPSFDRFSEDPLGGDDEDDDN